MYKVLIVDDEQLIRSGMIARFQYLNFTFERIREAASGMEALALLEKEPADIVITDIKMPDMDGMTLIREAKEKYPGTQFVVLSGYAEFEYAETAIELGVKSYLLKPNSSGGKFVSDPVGKALSHWLLLSAGTGNTTDTFIAFTPYCKKSIPKSQYYFSRISLRNGTANRLMCAPTNSRYIQKYNHIITTMIVERLPYTPKSLNRSMYAEKPQENRFQLIAVNNAPGNCFVSFSFTFGT